MNIRLVSAFALSFIVLLVYWYFFPPPGQQKSQANTALQSTQSTQSTQPAAPIVTQPINPLPEVAEPTAPTTQSGEKILLETEVYKIELDTLGAKITSLELKKYAHELEKPVPLHIKIWNAITGSPTQATKIDQDKLVNMVNQKSLLHNRVLDFVISSDNNQDYLFQAEQTRTQDQQKIRLTAQVTADLQLVKEFVFTDDQYTFQLTTTLINNGQQTLAISPTLSVGEGNEIIESSYAPQAKIGVSVSDGSFDKYKSFDQNLIENFDWVGIVDVYFAAAIKPTNNEKKWQAYFQPIGGQINDEIVNNPNLFLTTQPLTLSPQSTWSKEWSVYMGPKDFDLMEQFDNTFPEALDLVLNVLARPMLHTLRWLYTLVGNWGVSIMLLTLIVRILLFPLAYKSMHSMKRMSTLNPRIQFLRKKYGKDKPRLNQEIMELYKRNKVNPVTGCLPMLMQIPIFLALYWALLPAIELRHQPFIFWIKDLSSADPYLILPLCMGLSMFLQQKIAPPPSNLDPMQQKIMLFLPVLLTVMFVNFPAGLVLYWATSNSVSVIQQLIFNKAKIKKTID